MDEVISWLLDGDPAIRWQALAGLTDAPATEVAAERRRLAAEGWGERLLSLQADDGSWGGGLYQPKWTSTHYTLQLLTALGLEPGNAQALAACELLYRNGLRRDGGIAFYGNRRLAAPATGTSQPLPGHGEHCITGMALCMLASAGYEAGACAGIAAFLLGEQMPDGGWNCQLPRGATHASFHTTISVLEGLHAYQRLDLLDVDAVRAAQARGREFLLQHALFRSHRSGEVFDPRMTRFAFPYHWHYDALRALDYFQACGAERDQRLEPAIELVLSRRGGNGRWPLQNRWPGRTHFELEPPGPSRWNTLRALRVLRWWRG
jgi:hypothetical protein